MSFGVELHDHQARLASASAGNSFDKAANEVPIPPSLLGLGMAPSSGMPIPIAPTAAVPQFAALTDQNVAQRAALANREGQYSMLDRMLPEIRERERELAELRAEVRYQDRLGAQSTQPIQARLVDQVLTSVAARGPDTMCSVMPLLGAVGGMLVASRLGRDPLERVALAAAGGLFGAWLGHRLSPCAGDGPGLLDVLATARPSTGPVDRSPATR